MCVQFTLGVYTAMSLFDGSGSREQREFTPTIVLMTVSACVLSVTLGMAASRLYDKVSFLASLAYFAKNISDARSH